MANDHPIFIYRYMDRGTPVQDSTRFRNRVSASFHTDADVRAALATRLMRRAGIEVPRAYSGPNWRNFFESAPIEEVLSAITVAFQAGRESYPTMRWAAAFRTAVEEAMRDENMRVRIDEDGIVHYAVDEVFEGERLAALAVLNNPALSAARHTYENVFRYMDQRPPDTLAAARAMFDAVEIIARQICPEHKNLHVKLCRGQLRERCLAVLGGDAVELKVWGGMFEALVEWVDAIHNIRHGQPAKTSPLSEDFVVFAISSGSAYLRLLASVATRMGVQAVE